MNGASWPSIHSKIKVKDTRFAIPMKRVRELINIGPTPCHNCTHCKSPDAAFVTDTYPGEPFCDESCMVQYYNKEQHMAHRLSLDCHWGRIKLRSVMDRFIASGIITKYLVLCECIQVSDICQYIMTSFYIADMVTIYMWPSSLVVTNSRFITVFHGGMIHMPKVRSCRHVTTQVTRRVVTQVANSTSPGSAIYVLDMDPVTHETRLLTEVMRQYVPLDTNEKQSTRIANVVPYVLNNETIRTILYDTESSVSTYVSIRLNPRRISQRDVESITEIDCHGQEPLDFSDGWAHDTLVTKEGRLYLRGDNTMNQLGLAHVNDHGSAVFVHASPSDIPLLDVVCGTYQTFSITINGDLFACGDNTFGELGLGNTADRIQSHTRVTGLPPLCRVVCGYRFTFAIDIYGRLWATGCNTKGQLGLGDTNTRYRFELVPGINGRVVSVTCGTNLTVITLSDYSRWVSGSNLAGQQGIDESITHTTRFARFNYLPTLVLK